jgi:phosphoenolpyruvate-protein kinase (PTS system EI component)
MDPLDARIADLEAEIKRFVAHFETASDEAFKGRLLDTISSSRQTLNRLLDEKAASRAAPTAGISS